MHRCALVLVVILSQPAWAQDAPQPEPTDDSRVMWVVAGAGGADFPSNQLWGGVELAAHSVQRKGLGPLLRLTPAYSVSDNTAMLWAEAGGTLALQSDQVDEAQIRIGLLGRVQVPVVRWPLPVRVGEPGDVGVGLVPSAMAVLEIAWPDRPGITGALTVRGGVGSDSYFRPTCAAESDLACQGWLPGFVGSVSGRAVFPAGLHIEARAGTHMRLSVGRHW